LLDILCEDGPLLAVNKPAGLPTQAPAGVASLEAEVKQHLRQKYHKPGNVYLGIPHRLDRPVSGIVVFARNSKAAARLAEQFRLRQVRKFYLAIAEGFPEPAEGSISDWLLKQPDIAQMEVVPEGTPRAKLATLNYRLRKRLDVAGLECALVEIELETGRMHQIRAQFASRGWPILGDRRYGSRHSFVEHASSEEQVEQIALHAERLELRHPIRYDPIALTASLPEHWPAAARD
jgi:23S rRNA pseudouridine1911/1915/1917 synthase